MPDNDNAKAAVPEWVHGDRRPRWRRPSTWIAIALVALAAAGGWWWRQAQRESAAPRFITEPVTRGDLALSVTANGTLQPTRTVSIGSELSGTVSDVLVDVNDRVKKGQVLVRLDPAKLADQVAKSRAALQSARAALEQTQAATKEAKVTLARLEQVRQLSSGKLPAATELDAAQATAAQATANESAARANIAQAEATLRTDETNLAKASIRAPVDGVILTRAVEPGNAVAASLQAVTLFTMAEDLTRMKLSVNVDEADVGQVQTGQNARFSVSAWPGRQYPATITRVAYGSTTTDNVVTYTTQLDVTNTDLTLRPGMTATAIIAATERKDVLLVPNTALSFVPQQPGAAVAPARAGSGASGGIMSALMPRPPNMSGRRPSGNGSGSGSGAAKQAGGQKHLWVLQDGRPTQLTVQAGLSNGRLTEVHGEGLKEGMAVIVDQQSGAKS